ncbi:unnamed protein product, partial [Effrenium voratum]
VCPDDTVSGVHCILRASAEGPAVEDVSTNGTFLDGLRLGKGQPVVLAHGAVLSLPFAPSDARSISFRLELRRPADIAEALPPARGIRRMGAFSCSKARSRSRGALREAERTEPPEDQGSLQGGKPTCGGPAEPDVSGFDAAQLRADGEQEKRMEEVRPAPDSLVATAPDARVGVRSRPLLLLPGHVPPLKRPKPPM